MHTKYILVFEYYQVDKNYYAVKLRDKQQDNYEVQILIRLQY